MHDSKWDFGDQCYFIVSTYSNTSNFSARGLKSAPERSNLIIFEISVNLVREYFAYGGGVTLSCHGFPPYLMFLIVSVVHHIAKNSRGSGGGASWPPTLKPDGGLRRPPYPLLLWQLLPRPRFVAPEAFTRLEP